MRLLLTALLSCLMALSVAAQEKISLKMRAPVSEVLDEIEHQTNYLFVGYDIDLGRKVYIEVTNENIEKVLDLVFKDSGIEWQIDGVNIYLSKKKPAETAKSKGGKEDQAPSISGRIVDSQGMPLPGVAVMVNGSTAGAGISDMDGYYSVSADNGDMLLFSCLGFQDHTSKVGSSATIDITMQEEIMSLDETVVVGYRTVKKISMTGAVASLDIKQKENHPVTNTSQLLYNTPGVFVNQGGSKPGADAASITIRGVNSLNSTGGSPLVLLDGVETDMNAIDPATIESVTVLKDVSAAIYGIKAANGVILITTKKGREGRPKVEFRTKYGIQQIIQIPDVVTDPILYMKMRNLAEINSGVSPSAVSYSDAVISEYSAGLGTDPILYPSSDWYDLCMENGNLQQHNIRVSGGSGSLTYSAGAGYMRQKGIMIGNDYAKRYSYDVKIDAKITDRLSFRAAYQGASRVMYAPGYGTQANLLTLTRGIPIFADFYKDGLWYTTWIYTPGRNHPEIPTMYLTEGYTNTKYQDNMLTAGVDMNLPFALQYTSNFSYRKRDTFSKQFRPTYYGVNPKTGEVDTGYVSAVTSPFLTDSYIWFDQMMFSQRLSWTKDIEKHNIHLMVGQEYQHQGTNSFSAGNKDFNDNTLQELNAKGSDYTYATVSGSSSEAALVSYFGRVAYTYDDRYMLEATFRYDGSSKLAARNRWHLFPSISAAWNVNKEKWFHAKSIDILKLRGSYGIMGSESVSNYAYFMTVGAYSQNYSFGGTPATGYGVSKLTDTGLGWEKTASYDAGLDLMMWKGRFGFEFDAFYKKTYDILMTRAIPAHLGGLSGPTSNVGTIQNVGLESSVNWRDGIGKNFHYGLNGSFTYVKNKVLFLDGGTILQNSNTLITKENYPIRSFYVLEADGFFESYEEINSAEAVYGDRSALRPGYVKYVDQNGDGVVDNNDKIITKNSIPEITYSFGFNLGYKGLALEAQFQGVGNCYIYLTGNLATPFNNGAGVTREWATDSWTYATKESATLPILTTYTDAPMNFQPSTLWLRNCKYLRLKNLQLSYSIPSFALKRLGVSSLQIYLSCQNLLTITDFNIWDPEITSTNTDLRYDYPNLKSYTAGLNLVF